MLPTRVWRVVRGVGKQRDQQEALDLQAGRRAESRAGSGWRAACGLNYCSSLLRTGAPDTPVRRWRRQRQLTFLGEAAQLLKPGGVHKMVQGDVGLQPLAAGADHTVWWGRERVAATKRAARAAHARLGGVHRACVGL